MKQSELALSYLTKARARVRVLQVLFEQAAWSDVVREAQELVELALKGMLRLVGVDPPKWHDVGALLVEHRELFPPGLQDDLARLAEISKWLRKEREFSFYGDIDFVPTQEYGQQDAERAQTDALWVLVRAELLIDSG